MACIPDYGDISADGTGSDSLSQEKEISAEDFFNLPNV